MTGPPKKLTKKKIKIIKAYCSPTTKVKYKIQAKKRDISMSDLIKTALYEFCFVKTEKIREAPVLKVDRTPKGAPENSPTTGNYRKVMKEFKQKLKQGVIKKIE